MRTRRAAAGLGFFALLLVGCGAATHMPIRPDPQRWLSVDGARRHATITLVTAYDDAASGFNVNGANKGALLFSVPRGWQVTVHCTNNASGGPYACVLMPSPGVPVVAIQKARTPELAPGAKATFSFVPGAPTRYRLAAVTEGHQPIGMWVTLEVTASGTPSVRWVR